MIHVRVEDLIAEIEQTKRDIESAVGYRKKDLKRHLGKLYREMDSFGRYVRCKT